ncbi:MAG: hypothetical protein ABIQ58_05700 [Candidatus Limnocylindrales bacterium]
MTQGPGRRAGGGSARAGQGGLVALVMIAALVVGGCQYLFGLDPTEPGFEPYASPRPLATYTTGRATVDIVGGATVVLDRLSSPASLLADYGADTAFTGEGWFVRVYAAASSFGPLGPGGYLQLDRIVDGQHWTSADPSRCIVTVDLVDTTGLRGSATCKGLRWTDALGSGFMPIQPAYIEGQPAFDAEIIFEAKPGAPSS